MDININILVEKLIKSCFLFSLNFCSQSDPDLVVCVPPKLRDSASHSFMIRVAHNRKLKHLSLLLHTLFPQHILYYECSVFVSVFNQANVMKGLRNKLFYESDKTHLMQ